jgi:hypothetical protein
MKDNIDPEEAARLLEEKEAQASKNFPDETPIINLGKAESFTRNENANDKNSLIRENGWAPINIDLLPSEGRFYPTGTEIAIRAANVGEIRHFSTLDEKDIFDVDDKLNFIIDKCVRLKMPGKMPSYKDLKEEDRFFLLFAVRDLTFVDGENKLFVSMKCQCGQVDKTELKNENFSFYKLDEKLMRFYDEDQKCFIIEHPRIGTVKMYVPSLGVTSAIKTILRDRGRAGEVVDRAFARVSSFVFNDWRGLKEDVYVNTQKESLVWNDIKLSLVTKTADMIRFGVKTEITKNCSNCGDEVAAPLTFQGGIKSLFFDTDPFEKLFGE